MKSILLLCSVLAVSDASECNSDEQSLLQARTAVRTVSQEADMWTDVAKVRDIANSLLEGSDTTMSANDVNDALVAASRALAHLTPAIRQQLLNAQQEIVAATAAVQGCHHGESAQLRMALRNTLEQRADAVESCHMQLEELQAAETHQCGIAEDCLCDEARVRTTDKEELCTSMTETYEAAYCEHHHVCTLLHECHATETEVYDNLRADVEADIELIRQEYIAVEQSRCLTGLIQQAMTPPLTPIPHADLIACSNVDASEINIEYPNLHAEPAACPAHEHGDPECATYDEWTLVLQYGDSPYTPTSDAVGTLSEDGTGFAKLADAAINALPSGGTAAYTYYKLTSDSATAGDTDTIFFRVAGDYDDTNAVLGFSSWENCNAENFEDCTSWSSARGPTQGIDTYYPRRTNTCARWFTGYRNSVLCWPIQSTTQRCWAHGNSCSKGSHAVRTGVKMYKKTA